MEHFKDLVTNKPTTELLKMVYQFDEWNPAMLTAIEEELTKRNMLPTDLSMKRSQLIESERKRLEAGISGGTAGLVIGWICVLGLLGFYMGYRYKYATTISKYTGERYYTYNANRRRQGEYLLIASVVGLVVVIYNYVQ